MTTPIPIKYDFEPAQPAPGEEYEKFEERLLNAGAAKSDDRGWSLADHFLGTDEGGPGGPAMPAGGAAASKAASAFRSRQKAAYGMLAKHVLDADHITEMTNNHFQDGYAAFQYLRNACFRPASMLRLREMNKEFDDIDIIHDIGINHNSIKLLCKRIRTVNGKRPAGNRKTVDELAEKLLECIFTTSKHFSEGALIEYNATPANRQFQFAGARDFQALEAHYHSLWENAVNARLPGFQTRAAQTRQAAATRNTLEAGLAATTTSTSELGMSAGTSDTYVPRPISPASTLTELANVVEDPLNTTIARLACSRGTTTTTDWGLLSQEELCMVVDDDDSGDNSGGFEAFALFDADDQGSVEILCDNCGGAGHMRRVCPSVAKYRSHSYLLALHQARAGKSAVVPRRPPPRGQRGPFRPQPRRFQPFDKVARGYGRTTLASVSAPVKFRQDGRRQSGRSAEEGESSHESSSESAATASESAASAGELARKTAAAQPSTSSSASPGSSAIEMPTSFLSDDQLYEGYERGSIAEEREAEEREVAAAAIETEQKVKEDDNVNTTQLAIAPQPQRVGNFVARSIGTAGIVSLSAGVAIAAFLLACWQSLSRIVNGTLVAMALVLVTVPLAAPLNIERALDGGECGLLGVNTSFGMISSIVDSGATSTAIPESMAALVHTVTDNAPKNKLFIADDSGLDITKIGKSSLLVMGYKKEQPNVWFQDKLPISRALVVRGMGKKILLSVRGMKKDGVYAYFNDDNSTGTSDCIRLPNGTIVPFVPSNHAYNLSIGDTALAGSELPTPPRSRRPVSSIHAALGHTGARRINDSNISMDGHRVHLHEHSDESCRGCRLGNTGKGHVPAKKSKWKQGDSTLGFSHFGQQMDTDICTGFEPSFPHGFTAMTNFCDRWGHETFVYFLRSATAQEVCSSGDTLQSHVSHRLVDGKVGRWVTDNGKMFLGQETQEWAREMCRDRGFQTQNESNTLPVPERHWGVMERIMRSDLAQADAPPCLWTWGAAQANRLLYFLATKAHNPPQSPYAFTTGNNATVDLSWARTMYCDCTVTIPERDRDGKLGKRGADACHLGYDPRRGSHFCYVPSLQRLSSFIVTEWRESSFTICKTITADTPVEYFEALDLPVAPVTAAMVPRRFTARAAHRGAAAAETRPLVIVIVFPGRSREGDIASRLRKLGHTVHDQFDTAISPEYNMALSENQTRLKNLIPTADFVFFAPPCLTASIAFDPALRTQDEPEGRADLSADHRLLVDEANVLYDLVGDCAQLCDDHGVDWAIESSASRRYGPERCRWQRYARNGFLWDYPKIHRLNGTYICYAQCAFGAPWQKYTGLKVSKGAETPFRRIFEHAQCNCLSHEVVLRGWDTDGIAKTRKAQEYTSLNCSAFVSAILETRGSNQEGACTEWSERLNTATHDSLEEWAASASLEQDEIFPPSHFADDAHPPNATPTVTPPHRLDTEAELEFWLEDADGAYRVSEVGSFGKLPTTVPEAQRHPYWPLIKKAMEEEIVGKMANDAWIIVRRPPGAHVLKSRWVFAIKYNDDGTVKVVKARFVACGYSQLEGSDYDKIFAATLPGVSFRILMAMIATEDLETDHIDAVKAFTQSFVDRIIYVEMPEGFGRGIAKYSGYVLQLKKALEGIKQGAYLWFQHNKRAWLQLGFEAWFGEPNIYYLKSLGIRVGVFADDILSGYPAQYEQDYRNIKKAYAKLIKIDSENISPCLKFIGVQCVRDRSAGTITLKQTRYLEQLAEEYKGKFKPQSTPWGESKESRLDFDRLAPAENEADTCDRALYLSLTGKLVWPYTMTRVDLGEAIPLLASVCHAPTHSAYEKALGVLGYLVHTKNLGITFGGRLRVPLGLQVPPPHFEESSGLYTYHDSSFGSKPRPMAGYVIMYCNGPADWHAGALKIVPESSHEAESAIASRATKATCFIRQLLINNGRKVYGPTAMLGDNDALWKTVHHEGHSARVRHYERATLLFKRAVLLLILSPFKISDADMVADIFTKAVEKAKFVRMRDFVMNVHSTLRVQLEAGMATAVGASYRMMGSLMKRL